jgi:hypothetical protein
MTFSTPPDAAPRPAVRFHRFTGNGWEFECDPHGARGWCAVFMGAAPDRVTRLVDAIVLRGEPTARRVAVHEQHLSPRLQQRYYLQAVIATAGGITPSEVLLAQPLPGHRSLEARLAGQDSDWMEPVRAREVISPPEPRWRGDDDISPPSPDPSPAPALVPPDYPVPPARHSSGNGTGCPPAP